MRLLLAGVPGIGKTTVIRRIAERLEGELGWFYTRGGAVRSRGTHGKLVIGHGADERVVRLADRLLNGADRSCRDGAGRTL